MENSLLSALDLRIRTVENVSVMAGLIQQSRFFGCLGRQGKRAVAATMTFAAALCITSLVFFWIGLRESIPVGFLTAQRNMGLLFAATGGATLELTWLYFSCLQFPVYLSPAVLKWILRRNSGG